MPRCHFCGQPARGRYIQALGAIWHPEHFLCAGCERPIEEEQFQVAQNRPYHHACYLALQAPRCAYCGQPLAGSYVRSAEKPYHRQCFREHVVPRCIYCQKPLLGRYQVDAWGERYCAEHQQQYPHCSFCGRLIPPGQQTAGWQAYGSERCSVCRSTAVDAIEQAQPLFQECKQWIAGQGFRFNRLPLRLELHERACLLAMLQGRAVNHPLGVTLSTRHIQNGSVYSSSIEGVAVLQGMPALLFAGVVLHELGHVWLTVHGIESLPPWAEEGFCQLLSYTYYTGQPTPEARYRASQLEAESDPVYGEGFRRVRALAASSGFERFVETLRVSRRLPGSP